MSLLWMYDIDWKLLSTALTFYQGAKFEYIEVPWLVDKASVQATLPPFVDNPWQCGGGHLLGSGEQGFVALLPNLAQKRYCTITPCFREEVVDYLHRSWFMKLELYSPFPTRDELEYMLDICGQFFESQGAYARRVWLDDKHADLNVNDIEVGSYGIRTVGNTSFLYGTGLALPRFSQARCIIT